MEDKLQTEINKVIPAVAKGLLSNLTSAPAKEDATRISKIITTSRWKEIFNVVLQIGRRTKKKLLDTQVRTQQHDTSRWHND